MPTPAEVLKVQIAAAQARTQALLGPQPDPQVAFFQLLALPFMPGETVVDSVTGEEVQVVGGTIQNYNLDSPGAYTDTSGAGETA